MRTCPCRSLGHWVLIAAGIFVLTVAQGMANLSLASGTALLDAGKIRPDAIDLKVWVQSENVNGTQDGVPIVVHVSASRESYLTAVYLSALGDVVLIFPNRALPVSMVGAKAEYSLFGKDSRIQLKRNQQAKDAKLIFFVSSKPLTLDPLQIPDKQMLLRIPHSAHRDLAVFSDRLAEIGESKGFNRQVLNLGFGARLSLRLEGIMGLPLAIKSTKPGTLVGTQGTREEAEQAGKE